MLSGRWREAMNRIANHNSFIETTTVTRGKPEIHLSGSSAKDESAHRNASGNLQQGRITALMRFQVNPAEFYFAIAPMIVRSE
jgi:hypothetical protein